MIARILSPRTDKTEPSYLRPEVADTPSRLAVVRGTGTEPKHGLTERAKGALTLLGDRGRSHMTTKKDAPNSPLAGLDFAAELRRIRLAEGLPVHISTEVGGRVAAILYPPRQHRVDGRPRKAA